MDDYIKYITDRQNRGAAKRLQKPDPNVQRERRRQFEALADSFWESLLQSLIADCERFNNSSKRGKIELTCDHGVFRAKNIGFPAYLTVTFDKKAEQVVCSYWFLTHNRKRYRYRHKLNVAADNNQLQLTRSERPIDPSQNAQTILYEFLRRL